MQRAKKEKLLTPRAEMRDLRVRIATIKDTHRAGLRHDLTPLVRRLQVLKAAQALRRAEKALLKSVEVDKVSPQMELLGGLPADQDAQPKLPLAAQDEGGR